MGAVRPASALGARGLRAQIINVVHYSLRVGRLVAAARATCTNSHGFAPFYYLSTHGSHRGEARPKPVGGR